MNADRMNADGITAGGTRGGRAGVELERWYRRLLLAYPRSYRRGNGAEIVTTLMDAAEPGRGRPTGREVRDLIIGGLRQRFRLPVGRVMMLVALVSAVVFGALGGAAGSALGWATAPPLPSEAALGSVVGVAAGESVRVSVASDRQVLGLGPRETVGMSVPPGWDVGPARSRLVKAGWKVGPVEKRGSTIFKDDGSTIDAVDLVFVARKGSTEIMVSVIEAPGAEWHGFPFGMVMAQRAQPWSVLPLTLAGLLAGLVVGWLLVARIGYRVRQLSPLGRVPYVLVATFAGGALGVFAPAAYYTLGEMVVDAFGPDPVRPDRFGRGLTFATYTIHSPLDWLVIMGAGWLLLLIALLFFIPWKSANKVAT